MAKFLRHSERVHHVEYSFVFPGFGFPCDSAGNVFPRANEAAERNYQACVEKYGVAGGHIEEVEWSYTEPAIIECERCGGKVPLIGFTNTCTTCEEGGAITDYNLSGQLLAPRSQWGYETGETYADITTGTEE